MQVRLSGTAPLLLELPFGQRLRREIAENSDQPMTLPV